MRRVIVNEWMSLDGVVQAPGAADEDATGGFRHGGWHLRYFDDLSREWVDLPHPGGCGEPTTRRVPLVLHVSSGRAACCFGR